MIIISFIEDYDSPTFGELKACLSGRGLRLYEAHQACLEVVVEKDGTFDELQAETIRFVEKNKELLKSAILLARNDVKLKIEYQSGYNISNKVSTDILSPDFIALVHELGVEVVLWRYTFPKKDS